MAKPHNSDLIKYALALRGYKQCDVAEECSVEPSTVSMVINGRGRSAQIENRIAMLTGLSLPELWPDWHGPKAQRRRRAPMSPTQVADAIRSVAR